MESGADVVNTTASSVSVRTVATSVLSRRTSTDSGRGAESRNVTSVRAAVGGWSWTPMRSRKVR